MDTLGAFALATESPTDSVLKHQRPLKRDERVLTPHIARNILMQSGY